MMGRLSSSRGKGSECVYPPLVFCPIPEQEGPLIAAPPTVAPPTAASLTAAPMQARATALAFPRG